MRGQPIAVAVADADAAIRAGVRATLRAPRFEVRCARARRALGSLGDVDVLLVDERDPHAVDRAPAGTALAVLVREPTVPGMLAAFASGALGYVPRDVDTRRLALVVQDLAAGIPYVPPVIAAALVAEATGGRTGSGALTPRQSQVVTLARQGLSRTAIAAMLGVSEVTVRRHLADAQAKFRRAS